MQKLAPLLAAGLALLLFAPSASAAPATCSATSGPAITPVVGLFTSEGCSSCPPADQWASRPKGSCAVLQAFNVWSVTEHGHQSKVKAGENAGEHLKHDFVVRQYTRAGDYPASAETQKLSLRYASEGATVAHPPPTM